MKITSPQNFNVVLKQASAILFDLDQTLFNLQIDWMEIKKFIINHYSREYNAKLPYKIPFSELFDLIEEKKGNEVAQFYRNYMRDQELIAVKEHRYSPTWLQSIGVEQIAEKIRFDCFFGIISNNFHETILEILNTYELSSKFKVIIGRDDVSKEKPNPEGIIRVMDGYDLFPEKVIFIGDSDVDEMAADRAQVNYVHVDDLKKFMKVN